MTYDAATFLAGLFQPMDLLSPGDLPGDWRVAYEERAGIKEYCGKLSRQQAEAEALTETVQAMRIQSTRQRAEAKTEKGA